MIAIKYLALCIIVCAYYTHSKVCNDQSSTRTRQKRAISPVSGKLFKKHQVSLESFTKVASTRLDTQTWPRLVLAMFISIIIYIYIYNVI